MEKYCKIKTVYKRNPDTKFKTLLEGQFSLPEFDYLKYNEWVFTEKVDGTNIRIMFQNGRIKFSGKTDDAQIPAKLTNWLNDKFSNQIETMNEMFDDAEVCLYGEGYGAKIQKGGGNYSKEQQFALFDVKIDEWWLKRSDIEDIAIKLHIDIVPIIGSGNLFDMVERTRKGFDSAWGDFTAEGIVARPMVELFARNGRRIITKIKHKDFK